MAVDINRLWEEKISNRAITDMVYKIARGDKDLYQEGLLGVRYGLSRNPDFSDDQLIREARWYMGKYKRRGVSLDNGPNGQYRKTMPDGTMKTYTREAIPIYIDAVMDEFNLEFPGISYPPDILAIDKVCAEKFYKSLNNQERHFVKICIEVLYNHFYMTDAIRKLHYGKKRFFRIRAGVYKKFIRFFGTDEEITA
jgi:hypothetical protein